MGQTRMAFGNGRIVRAVGKSAADTAKTVATTPTGRPFELVAVLVVFSAAVSKTAAVSLDAGAGADYDCALNTITLTTAASGAFLPSAPLVFSGDDAITVTAQAGGGTNTSTIQIITREF